MDNLVRELEKSLLQSIEHDESRAVYYDEIARSATERSVVDFRFVQAISNFESKEVDVVEVEAKRTKDHAAVLRQGATVYKKVALRERVS